MTTTLQAHSTTLEAICSRKGLSEALQLVGHAVSERNPLPILTHVLIQSVEGGLLLSASDLELGIATTVPADVRQPGAITAPSKLISDLLATFPDGEITIAADRSHSTAIRIPGSDYRIAGQAPEEYPTLPEVDDTVGFRVAQPLLRQAIRQTIFAVLAENKGRPQLTGVLLEFGESTLTMVSTDTLRMSIRSAPVSDAKGAMQVIVPARALANLARCLNDDTGDVAVRLTEKQAEFVTSGGVRVYTRLIEGQFPAYRRVIPQNWQTRISLPTGPFQQAVKRVSIVARSADNRMEMRTHEQRLVLRAEASPGGKAVEEIEALVDGPDIETAFHTDHLLDILSAIDTEGVDFEMTDPGKAALIKPRVEPDQEARHGEYCGVLMPLHLL